MNLRQQFAARLIIPMFALCSAVFAIDATAQSACKGLSKSQCGGNQSCTWVSAFTRGDGAKVSAYCRAKGGGGNKKPSEGKKKSSEKSSDKPENSTDKKSSKTKKSSKAESSSKKKSSSKSKSKKE